MSLSVCAIRQYMLSRARLHRATAVYQKDSCGSDPHPRHRQCISIRANAASEGTRRAFLGWNAVA